MLPDVKGFEVLPELRRSVRTPVVMLTAKGEEFDRALGLEMGLTTISRNRSVLANCL